MTNYHQMQGEHNGILGLNVTDPTRHNSVHNLVKFNDLDDLISSTLADPDPMWWVQTRETNDTTCDLNWDLIRRFDGRESLHTIHSFAKYVGGVYQVYDSIRKGHTRLLMEVKNSKQSLFREALIEGSRIQTCYGKTFLGKEHTAAASAYWERVRWRGTPEENLRMLTAAAKYFGAQEIGAMELTQIQRKLLFSYPRGNNKPPASYGKAKATADDFTHNWPPPDELIKPIMFEDVPRGYEAPNRYVIPEKPLWIISIMMPPVRATLESQSSWGSNYDANTYRVHVVVQECLQDFLRSLGYQGMGYMDDIQGLLPATAAAVLTGLAEMTRNNNCCLSPRYGTTARYFSLITDLPLAPTRPINAGIFNNCHSCTECASVCPVSAISLDTEPTWEVPAIEGIPNEYSGPGKKLYHAKTHLCRKFTLEQSNECGLCMSHCPFSAGVVGDRSAIKERERE